MQERNYPLPETWLSNLKIILREKDAPFFTDDEIQFYFNKNKGDFDATVYECLILKSQDTTLSISGLSTADSSNYFRRVAMMYRPNHSGILKS